VWPGSRWAVDSAWLTRRHGLAVDNLVSADVLLADGTRVRASREDDSELLWAIRGGGGNFFIVTAFELRLHAVGPDVFAGLVIFPLAEATRVLTRYRELAPTLPDELSIWAIVRKAPPLSFLPPSAHAAGVVMLALFSCGDPGEAERVVMSVRGFGTVIGEQVTLRPYCAWQKVFDWLLGRGARNYWKSHYFRDLSDQAIAAVVRHAEALPSRETAVVISLLGGAAGRVAPDAAAYAHRDAQFVINIQGRCVQRDLEAIATAWTRELFRDLAPAATGGVYVNFMTDDEVHRVPQAYGRNLVRLATAKRRYDPTNVFRSNQNIAPAAAG
jgi:hypothetical protein